jgi:hypothetical protein
MVLLTLTVQDDEGLMSGVWQWSTDHLLSLIYSELQTKLRESCPLAGGSLGRLRSTRSARETRPIYSRRKLTPAYSFIGKRCSWPRAVFESFPQPPGLGVDVVLS